MNTIRWDSREPALKELMADPIMQQLMHRDGVKSATIFGLARRVRRAVTLANRLTERASAQPA